jgi:hypothetical protein
MVMKNETSSVDHQVKPVISGIQKLNARVGRPVTRTPEQLR